MIAPRRSCPACSTVSGETVSTTSRVGEDVAVDDGRAGLAVGVVGGEGVPAGAGLDGDLEPGRDQLADGVGHESDPALARAPLCGDTRPS